MLSETKWPSVAANFPWKTLDNGNLRSTVVRLSYAKLFAPSTYKGKGGQADDNAKPRYGVTLLLPKGDKADDVVAALHAIIRGQFGTDCVIGEVTGGAKPTIRVDYKQGGKPGRANLAWPLVDQGEFVAEGYVGGAYLIAAYTYDKPRVVDAARNIVTDENAVYSGCYAFVTIRPYWAAGWDRISVGLQAVQFLADGERLGGGAPAIDEMFDDMGDEFGAIAASGAASAASGGLSSNAASMLD